MFFILLEFCTGNVLAFASTCMLDVSDNNRPVAGFINICPLVREYIHTLSTVYIHTGPYTITSSSQGYLRPSLRKGVL